MHDSSFRDALIIDGTGAPRDAAMSRSRRQDRPLGSNLGGRARDRRRAGRALAPGIIDGLRHYDAQITWDPYVDPSPSVGVTTVVIGNCGFTIAPCRPADRDITMRNLTHVEGMSLEALRDGHTLGLSRPFPSISRCSSAAAWCRTSRPSSAIPRCAPSCCATTRASAPRPRPRSRRCEPGARRDGRGRGRLRLVDQRAAHGEGGVPMPSRLADEHEYAHARARDGRRAAAACSC
jgi:hypothetical protein